MAKKRNINDINGIMKDLEKAIVKNPYKATKKIVESSTRLVMNTAQESIKQAGRGRQYYRKNGPNHIASAPGDPPATDTGFLGQNITMEVREVGNKGAIEGVIISAAPYSKALEFGTRNMAPRPFMQPALRKNRKAILDKFKKGGLIDSNTLAKGF